MYAASCIITKPTIMSQWQLNEIASLIFALHFINNHPMSWVDHFFVVLVLPQADVELGKGQIYSVRWSSLFNQVLAKALPMWWKMKGAHVSVLNWPHWTFIHPDPIHRHLTLTLTRTSKSVHGANYNKDSKPWYDEEHFSKMFLLQE